MFLFHILRLSQKTSSLKPVQFGECIKFYPPPQLIIFATLFRIPSHQFGSILFLAALLVSAQNPHRFAQLFLQNR